MNHRKLGRNGPSVFPIGLGCMSIGIADTYTSSVRSDEEAVALIHRGLDLGITLLDTADVYGNSERQVGKAIKGRRTRSPWRRSLASTRAPLQMSAETRRSARSTAARSM